MRHGEIESRPRRRDYGPAEKRVGSIYALQSVQIVFKSKYLEELELHLYDGGTNISLPDEATALKKIDTQGWLKLMFTQLE